MRLTKDRDPIVATDVGQHQMWTAQYFKLARPNRWLTSVDWVLMGFGLPAAMGAQAAFRGSTGPLRGRRRQHSNEHAGRWRRPWCRSCRSRSLF